MATKLACELPNAALRVIATDTLGASSHANVTLTVKSVAVPSKSESFSGGSMGWLSVLALVVLRARRSR